MTEPDDFTLEEYCNFLVEALIEHSKALNYLAERNIALHTDVIKVAKMVRNINMSIKYAVPGIKELTENYDGMCSYLSVNLSPRLETLEGLSKKKEPF